MQIWAVLVLLLLGKQLLFDISISSTLFELNLIATFIRRSEWNISEVIIVIQSFKYMFNSAKGKVLINHAIEVVVNDEDNAST